MIICKNCGKDIELTYIIAWIHFHNKSALCYNNRELHAEPLLEKQLTELEWLYGQYYITQEKCDNLIGAKDVLEVWRNQINKRIKELKKVN